HGPLLGAAVADQAGLPLVIWAVGKFAPDAPLLAGAVPAFSLKRNSTRSTGGSAVRAAAEAFFSFSASADFSFTFSPFRFHQIPISFTVGHDSPVIFFRHFTISGWTLS